MALTMNACPESTEEQALDEVLTRAHALLAEVFTPAGALLYWSSRLKYLDGARPCDLTRLYDVKGLQKVCKRLTVLADRASR